MIEFDPNAYAYGALIGIALVWFAGFAYCTTRCIQKDDDVEQIAVSLVFSTLWFIFIPLAYLKAGRPRSGRTTGRQATCRESENKVQTTKILADAPPTRPLDGSP